MVSEDTILWLSADRPGCPEKVQINAPNYPKQLLCRQLFLKINLCGCPFSWPAPGSLWYLDLSQMVLAVLKVEINPSKHPIQLLFQQLCPKTNPWGCPCARPKLSRDRIGSMHDHFEKPNITL